MFSYFVYISFHPCQIPKKYGFKLELLPGPKTVDATYLSMIYVACLGQFYAEYCLLPMHWRCDTTSSFFGVGKRTMYKVLKDSQKEFVDFSQISYDDIETSVAVGRKFVARLYGPKARFTYDHGDLNKLRSRIAQQKDASLVKLLPCEATFRQHVLFFFMSIFGYRRQLLSLLLSHRCNLVG